MMLKVYLGMENFFSLQNRSKLNWGEPTLFLLKFFHMYDIVEFFDFAMFTLPLTFQYQLTGSRNIQGFALVYEQPCFYNG